MKPQQVREMLEQTLADRTLSRGEKTQLTDIFEPLHPDPQLFANFRSIAFELARQTIDAVNGALVIQWLEDVNRLLQPRDAKPMISTISQAFFSPKDDCPREIRSQIAEAKRSIDICVFTITDDRLTSSIIDAHRRGIKIRIISDDEKSEDLGSDTDRFLEAGIPLRLDRSRFHMHHKFAIFDSSILLNGSYNWTRGAAENNEENFVLSGDPRLINAFMDTFESLWEQLGRND